MSDLKKVSEMSVSMIPMLAKVAKWSGWIFIAIGVMVMLSIVGIPLGVMLVLAGGALLFGSKMLLKNQENISGATMETMEIHEYNLKVAREGNNESGKQRE